MNKDGLSRLKTIARNAELDALVVLPGYNLHYLTGVSFHLLERPFMVFVPVDGEPVTVLPSLEAKQFVDTGIGGQIFDWSDADGYEQAFSDAFATMQINDWKIGVEGLTMRFAESQIIRKHAPDATLINADEALVALRVQKTKDEIANHKHAIGITEQALTRMITNIQIGMTERFVSQQLAQFQQENGGESLGFAPIVLFGERSALPHGEPGDTELRAGDTILIDFGTKHKGYVSDITRVFFAGEPTEQMRSIYDAVLAANEAGRNAARPGITGADLDAITAQTLRDHGFGEYIVHRTGHGIGLNIHEHPNISAENHEPLQAGMAFTIEPGLYMLGVGGVRIEDDVVLTEDGCESLSTFPRDLTVLQLS